MRTSPKVEAEVSKIDISTMQEMVANGATYEQIANHFGVSEHIINSLGGSEGSSREKMILKRQMIYNMAVANHTPGEIAEATGLKIATVRARLSEMRHQIRSAK